MLVINSPTEMTPEEKAEELYNRFDMIIYTAHDHNAQVLACMTFFIDSMINEHYFDEDDARHVFWQDVKACKEKMYK